MRRVTTGQPWKHFLYGRILLLLKVCLVSSHHVVTDRRLLIICAAWMHNTNKNCSWSKNEAEFVCSETWVIRPTSDGLLQESPEKPNWQQHSRWDQPVRENVIVPQKLTVVHVKDIQTCWVTFRLLWERYRSVLLGCIHGFYLKVSRRLILDERVIFHHFDINGGFRNFSPELFWEKTQKHAASLMLR